MLLKSKIEKLEEEPKLWELAQSPPASPRDTWGMSEGDPSDADSEVEREESD